MRSAPRLSRALTRAPRRGAARSPASAAAPWRRLASSVRSRSTNSSIIGISAIPAPVAADLAPHPAKPRTLSSPRARMRWSSSTARISPIGSRAACARRAPSIPILDYVSPSVWAWRSGRARAMRAYVDCVLAILPFEPAAHRRLGGPPCIYVGHPLVERLAELRPDAEEAGAGAPSRRLFWSCPAAARARFASCSQVFGAAIARRGARVGAMELVLPTVPHSCRRVGRRCRLGGQAAHRHRAGRKMGSIPQSARAALAASGTVTLELALAGVPTVAAYRVTFIEEIVARVARIKQRLPSVILANLVIGENIVPEFLQHDCTPERLAEALVPLLSDTPEWRRQIEAFARLDDIMALKAMPSAKAAAIVLDAARGRGPP